MTISIERVHGHHHFTSHKGGGILGELTLRPNDFDWWLWLAIGVSIAVGLSGNPQGYDTCRDLSILHLFMYLGRDQNIFSFRVQVRIVWLLLVLTARVFNWFYVFLFGGMVLVVGFDKCGIARVLERMPWNQGIAPLSR